MRKIRDQENELLAKNTMKAVYTENESLSGYNRKRKAICFETCTTPKRSKCHTPKLDDVSWNKENSSESFRLGQQTHSSTGVRLQESIKFLVEMEVRLQKNLLEGMGLMSLLLMDDQKTHEQKSEKCQGKKSLSQPSPW